VVVNDVAGEVIGEMVVPGSLVWQQLGSSTREKEGEEEEEENEMK